MASQAVLQFLQLPLLGHGLLLLDESFLLHLCLLIEMVLLNKILCVLETQSLLLLIPVQGEGFAKFLSDEAKICSVEMIVHFTDGRSLLAASMWLILHRLWSAEGSLHSEDIGVLLAEISPHCYSSSLLLSSTNAEPRVVVGEMRLSDFGHQEWEDSRCFLLLILTISIHEYILSSAVSMQVTVQSKGSFLRKLHDQLLGMVDCWVEDLAWVLPSPVEVTPS